MLKRNHWPWSLMLLNLATGGCFGLSPASTEQSVLSIPKVVTTEPAESTHKKILSSGRAQYIKKRLNNPELKKYILSLLKHPYFTSTAKSIYSPAAVPFQWGASVYHPIPFRAIQANIITIGNLD